MLHFSGCPPTVELFETGRLIPSETGSKPEQFSHSVTYRAVKTIIHNRYSSQWRSRLEVSSSADPIHQLQRHQQTNHFVSNENWPL